MRVEKKSSGEPEKDLEQVQPIESDYEAHSDQPAPSETAVKEENDEGAGRALKWIIPIIVVVLFLIYFIFLRSPNNL